MEKMAATGNADIKLYKHPKGVREDLSLSYSGLKTAVVNYVNTLKQKGEKIPVADICASFTNEALTILVKTASEAMKRTGRNRLVLAGGVASNGNLREMLCAEGKKCGFTVTYPPHVLCTDNAAMVASRAYFTAREGLGLADLSLNARSHIPFGESNERK